MAIMRAIFLDLETSGLDYYHHRVLEIAFKMVDVHSGREEYAYHSIVKQPWAIWEQRDPSSVAVNGFTWEKTLSGKDEHVIGQEIVKIFTDLKVERGKVVYICQNPAFDRSFFSQLVSVYTQEKCHWPYHWLDFASMYWALQVKKMAQEHHSLPSEMNLSKNVIAQQFQLPPESDPHTAMNGVDHLILCYRTIVGFC